MARHRLRSLPRPGSHLTWRLPLADGMRVGLFGGSFDPAHAGHLHVTREALRRFALDRIVWLVSPGNPLKTEGPAPLARRMTQARRISADDPRILVSDVEARAGSHYTAYTLAMLQAAHPATRFVWLMGADNLAQFHRWQDWRGILARIPIGVLARPEARISARVSVAARVFRHAQLAPHAARLLPDAEPPAWCFLNVPMRDDSSTKIRADGGWDARPGQGG